MPPKANNNKSKQDANWYRGIQLVLGYPEIYDIACPGHKKEVFRNNAWQQILEALFLPGETLKYENSPVTDEGGLSKKLKCQKNEPSINTPIYQPIGESVSINHKSSNRIELS